MLEVIVGGRLVGSVRREEFDAVANFVEALGRSTASDRRRALDWLRAQGGVATRAALARGVGVSKVDSINLVSSLVATGDVTMARGGRAGSYTVLLKGEIPDRPPKPRKRRQTTKAPCKLPLARREILKLLRRAKHPLRADSLKKSDFFSRRIASDALVAMEVAGEVVVDRSSKRRGDMVRLA